MHINTPAHQPKHPDKPLHSSTPSPPSQKKPHTHTKLYHTHPKHIHSKTHSIAPDLAPEKTRAKKSVQLSRETVKPVKVIEYSRVENQHRSQPVSESDGRTDRQTDRRALPRSFHADAAAHVPAEARFGSKK